jgi:hypothetical protein
LAALGVAAVMLVAGGIATASNVAFKANLAIELVPVSGTFFQGANRIALPFNHPYTSIDDFCDQTGLVCSDAGGATPCALAGSNPASITVLNTDTASFVTKTCGFGPDILKKGHGLEIRQPTTGGATPATPPTSIIVVGSHDPTFSIDMNPIGATLQEGNYWFPTPYHTTAANVAELCTSSGLDPVGTITILDPVSGAFFNCSCGSTCTAATLLELGRTITLRDTSGSPHSFIPAHF